MLAYVDVPLTCCLEAGVVRRAVVHCQVCVACMSHELFYHAHIHKLYVKKSAAAAVVKQGIALHCRGVVDTSLSILRPVPLIGALADKAGEILYGIQQYYTYTSAS